MRWRIWHVTSAGTVRDSGIGETNARGGLRWKLRSDRKEKERARQEADSVKGQKEKAKEREREKEKVVRDPSLWNKRRRRRRSHGPS